MATRVPLALSGVDSGSTAGSGLSALSSSGVVLCTDGACELATKLITRCFIITHFEAHIHIYRHTYTDTHTYIRKNSSQYTKQRHPLKDSNGPELTNTSEMSETDSLEINAISPHECSQVHTPTAHPVPYLLLSHEMLGEQLLERAVIAAQHSFLKQEYECECA